ncbi:MAG: hypothetical protein H0V03_08465 [Thermoleophilaceae bacterium]|nr:hypothetical protein [Thermoleophilaceae bacterium]
MSGPLRQIGIAVAAGLALGACGSERQPIPRAQAAALIADLEEAQRRVDAGACGDVEKGTFVRLDRRVERLPDDIDSDVEQALRDGVGHLKDVAEEECAANRPARTTTPDPTPVPSTTKPAPTTSTTPPTDTPKGKGSDEDEEAPPSTEPPPPKDPDPPAETPGGGTPAQPEEQGKSGDGGTAVVPAPVQRGLRALEREGRERLGL